MCATQLLLITNSLGMASGGGLGPGPPPMPNTGAVNVRATEKVVSVNEDEELRQKGFTLGMNLGEGSYAKVKSAFWTKNHKRVAIKIINKKKAPKDFKTKFLPRELDIMKKLKHPHIIELFDIMQFNGKVYMVLEMAGHGDMLEYIKLRGAIPNDKAAIMYYQLAHAIAYLHSMSIVHRDLKCENILLDAKNMVKVSDFGFARNQAYKDMSSTFCGSAAYAAPEILQGIPYIGEAYDVWSMGVILYIMVCGSMPYDDTNVKKMIRNQIDKKVSFPQRQRKLNHLVKELIHSMLEAKVELRVSMEDVLNHQWLCDAARSIIDDNYLPHLTSRATNVEVPIASGSSGLPISGRRSVSKSILHGGGYVACGPRGSRASHNSECTCKNSGSCQCIKKGEGRSDWKN